MSRWREIWSNRKAGDDASLAALIRLDGFDLGAGKVDTGAWVRYCADLSRRLGIGAGDSIFEVGCGSGALLHVFHATGHNVGGIDFSPAQVAVASRVMPGMLFSVCAASDLAAPPHDFVLANSVFSYFPDLAYSRRVLQRMLAAAKKGIAILDVPDLALQEASEAYRRGALPPGEYESRYQGLAHLYHERDWFRNANVPKGWRVRIEDQALEGYGNAPYRFNVLIAPDEVH